MSQGRFVVYLSQPEVAERLNRNSEAGDISQLFDGLPEPAYLNELLASSPIFWQNLHWDGWITLALQVAYDDLFDENGQIKKEVADALEENTGFKQLCDNISKNFSEGMSEEARNANIKLSLFKAYYENFFMAPIAGLIIKNNKMDPAIMKIFYDELRREIEIPSDHSTTDQITDALFSNWMSRVGGVTVDNIDIGMFTHKHLNATEHVNDMIQNEKELLPDQSIKDRIDKARQEIAIAAAPKPAATKLLAPLAPLAPLASPPPPAPSFFARNWGYFAIAAIGIIAVAGLIILGVLTGGLVPALVASAVIVAASGLAAISVKVATSEPKLSSSTKQLYQSGLEPDVRAKPTPNAPEDRSPEWKSKSESTSTLSSPPKPNVPNR